MVEVIRKDNLTDLVQAPPPTNNGGNTTPTPQQPNSGNHGQPATQATNSNGQVIQLGQNNIKVK